MELVIVWIMLGVIVALIAYSKGRNSVGWFFYGFLIFPVAVVHAIVVPRLPGAAEKAAAAEGRIPCPFCAEMIKPSAIVCPHCRRDLDRVLKQQRETLAAQDRDPKDPFLG